MSPRKAQVRDILVALAGAFEGRGWHGPSVLGTLRGLPAARALKRPRGGHHSIQELVEHIAYWERRALLDLAPGGPGPGADWAAPRRSFPASVRHLKAVHRELVRAVSALKDDDLGRRVRTGDGPMPLGKVLHGVAAHGCYHAGQIGLLKTLV
jgi:uncharacterized damage-inducible protein DinB